MSEGYSVPAGKVDIGGQVSLSDRISFRIMSLIHEDLYGLLRDPYGVLVAAGLEPAQKVLEVGCGPGFFTLPAAEIVGESGCVYALDISPLAIEKVQRKARQAGVTNVETVLADVCQTGLPDGCFDLIFLFGLGRAMGNRTDIWAEMHRILAPGGIVAVEGRLLPPSEFFSPFQQRGRISQFRKMG